MKLYYVTGHDFQGDIGELCINQICQVYKTREAAEDYLSLLISDIRQYLQYLHKEDGVNYTDEIKRKNGNMDYFIAKATYDLSDLNQYEAFLQSPKISEAGLCNDGIKIVVSIDHDAQSFRKNDDNTMIQTFASLSINEIETDNLK